MSVRVLLGLLCLPAFWGCTRLSFPSIDNPQQLVQDCDVLLAGGHNRMLSPAQWPNSIRILKPTYVCINDTDVMIAIQAGGDEGARGIFVSHSTPFVGHQTLSQTRDANIYHFEWAR